MPRKYTRRKGITPARKKAQMVNWSKYRLHGALTAVNSIACMEVTPCDVVDKLIKVEEALEDALATWEGV